MTHYSVLVKYEGNIKDSKLDEMLAPFDENLSVEPYKKYITKGDLDRMQQYYYLEKLEDLIEKVEDWSGCPGGLDEQGLFYWSRYNPNSKWNWYSLGGRYSGAFLVKKTATEYVKGKLGVFKNEVGIDMAYLKDLDFEKMKEKNKEEYIQSWEKFISEQKVGTDPGMEMWFYGIEDEDTLETFLKRHGAETSFTTCAVLDKDGWHEPSKMGWFGCDYDRTEDETTWSTKYFDRFLKDFTENTVVAVVDCHI